MPDVLAANLLILGVVLVAPFVSRIVEHNLEAFLFAMGMLSSAASGVLTARLVGHALRDPIPITAAVFLFGMGFAWGRHRLTVAIRRLVASVGPRGVAAAAIVVLGLASSVITAIIASLVLVEFLAALRLSRRDEVRIVVVACFAVGLGAALTPVGEPLSTIAIAKLGQDFWFLARLLGPLVIPGVFLLGFVTLMRPVTSDPETGGLQPVTPREPVRAVAVRAARVYLFVMALTLLGEGFRPLIDRYVLGLSGAVLYWINIVSAILDNATLTAAEISPRMTEVQVRAVLMGLLISGGMLIPGNIPNIIAAGKLGIRSREWAAVALPIGSGLLVAYFITLFLIL